MSTVRSFQVPPNDYNKLQYTQYLEEQLEKLSLFMLYQKKENQKNNQLMKIIQDQNQKIKIINDKIHLFEIYQHQNFKNHTKTLDLVEKIPVLEKKVQKLQFTLHENKYDNVNLTSKSQKVLDLKNEIQQMIRKEISSKFRQIQDIMDLKQERLTAKIISIRNQKEPIEQQYSVSNIDQSRRNVCCSKNSTGLRTNETQHNRSKVRDIQSSEIKSKRVQHRNQHKISSFVPDQFNKLEKQTQILVNPRGINKSTHSFTDRVYKEKKPRSPISSYLQKQKDFYESQKQNIDFNNHEGSVSFYSVLQKSSNSVVNNKKQKRKRSKSKSLIKSQKEHSSSNLFKQKSKLKNDKKKSEKSQKKSNINEQQPKKPSFLTQKTYKKSKSKKSNNKSQLSLSQNSIKSLSHSRKSIPKQFKNQKQYLKYCNKLHC